MDISKFITCDVECYINYFLVVFRKVTTGDVLHFEKFNDSELQRKNILHILNKYTILTFNGNKYDITMLECALMGLSNKSLKLVTNMLIEEGKQPWQVRKQLGVAALKIDHIDLIEVAPLTASLKIYGGRMDCPTMQDLPLEPDAVIQDHQRKPMLDYCINDNEITWILGEFLLPELELRYNMTEEYGVDMRSKSDAQIAEAVFKKALSEDYNISVKRPKVEEGTRFRYKPPENLMFETEIMNYVFNQYCTRPFTIGAGGYSSFNFELLEEDRIKSGKNKGKMPDKKGQFKFKFKNTKYTVGIGGLHSNEKSTRVTNDGYILRDYDVASFYPWIILLNELFPKHIGKPFLKIYRKIVMTRLDAKDKQKAAKKSGDKKLEDYYKVINESLKIVINGLFGKLGSKWSAVYSPDLMMQVTITGQLSLLMLIERLELAGISVISANTDGIVTKFKPEQEDLADGIIGEWMLDTGYDMEATDYTSLNSRDVNNYIAVADGYCKGKGAYADQSEHYYRPRSNPVNRICVTAVKEFLQHGTPVETTVRNCKDVREFLTVRTVNGGAVKNGKLIGKAIRWYYGNEELDAIYYSTSGNKVPKSEGGVPLMVLPDTIPSDLDYDWYIEECKTILKNIGFKKAA